MFDRWEYTILANTTEANRIPQECKISAGILQNVKIFFPLGTFGLARCRVRLGEKPILPRSHAGYVTGNGTWSEALNQGESTKENLPVLRWELWNLDDTNPHTLAMEASWIAEEEGLAERSLLARMVESLDGLRRSLTGGAY